MPNIDYEYDGPRTTVDDREIQLDRLFDELPDNHLEEDLDTKKVYTFNGIEYD